MSLATLQGGRGISFDDYFKQALNLDVSKLEAIIRGQDHSMPIVAAMAAYEVKKPMATAAAGQQAAQQLQQAHPTVRQEMEQEMQQAPMIPDMAMLQQQRMGPQPPVQPPQGGLPEQGGVGALPAPNMQGMAMAHGGIIAFDDGGDVPGYAGDDESLVDEYYGLPFGGRSGSEEYWQRPVMPYGEQMRNVGRSLKKGVKNLFSIPDTEVDKEADKKKQDKEEKEKVTGKKTPAELKTASRDLDAMLAARPSEFTNVPPRVAGPRAGAPAAGGAAPSAPAQPVGIDAALDAQKKLTGGAQETFTGALKDYEKEATAGIDALRKTREEGRPTGQAYSKYEESLMKDEEAAKGKEDRNLKMALVNAGLAIAGGTSRYALENIGKGSLVGTKQYMEGVDKLEAAAKERQKAFAMIEEARRAEARGDWKEKNDFESKAMEVKLGAKKMGVEGLAKIYDVNTRTAADIFNTMETNATRERMAKEQNKTELQKAGIMASAYGARQLTPAMAVKEANDAYEKWALTPQGKLDAMKPGVAERKRKEILIETFKNMGIPFPANVDAKTARPSNLPPLSPTSTPDLFK